MRKIVLTLASGWEKRATKPNEMFKKTHAVTVPVYSSNDGPKVIYSTRAQTKSKGEKLMQIPDTNMGIS